jgi:hypothetical protein
MRERRAEGKFDMSLRELRAALREFERQNRDAPAAALRLRYSEYDIVLPPAAAPVPAPAGEKIDRNLRSDLGNFSVMSQMAPIGGSPARTTADLRTALRVGVRCASTEFDGRRLRTVTARGLLVKAHRLLYLRHRRTTLAHGV